MSIEVGERVAVGDRVSVRTGRRGNPPVATVTAIDGGMASLDRTVLLVIDGVGGATSAVSLDRLTKRDAA